MATAVKEVNLPASNDVAELGRTLTYDSLIVSSDGFYFPDKVSMEQKTALHQLIQEIGGLTGSNSSGRMLEPNELVMRSIVVVPEASIVVMRPKNSRFKVYAARESDVPLANLHSSVDVLFDVKDNPRSIATLGFDVYGHMVKARQEEIHSFDLPVATIEVFQNMVKFVGAAPSEYVYPSSFVILFQDCQPADQDFVNFRAVNVIAG